MALANAAAQQAAAPVELDPLTVETQKAKRKPTAAKTKTQPKTLAKSPLPVAAPAETAQAAEPPSGTGKATKPGLNLNNPNTGGSRLNLTPLETPASVEVISGDTVRERGQTSINTAVTQNATGFTSTASPGNGGSGLAARGFTGHGSVMQLYDGTRLYVGAGTVTFPFDTWSADRIEVLRGPASVMYGEGAIGGVINVVPKKPTDFFTGEGEVAIGTDGTRRFGAGAGGPISDRLAYRIDASGIQSDGWLDREGDYSSLAFSGALRFKATPDLRFTLSHDYGKQNPLRYWGTPLISGTVPDSIRFKSYNVDDSKVEYTDNWTQLKTEWNPASWFSLRSNGYRLTTDRLWRDVEDYDYQETGANAGKILRTSYLEILHDQEQVGNRTDATFRSVLPGGMENDLVVGFDANRIDFRHTNNNRPPLAPNLGTASSFVDPFNFNLGQFINLYGTRPRYDTDTTQYALFGENRLALSKQLSLIGGIRFDHADFERTELAAPGGGFDKTFANTTWRAGAVYTPIPGLALYGQYATGVDPVGGLVSLAEANRSFDLATGRQIEIGIKQSFWNGRGEWTLAGYDIEKKNVLSRDPNNSQIIRQVGQQSSRGVELSVALQVLDNLRYEGNVALLQAEYDVFVASVSNQPVSYAGNTPVNVPEQIVNNWLAWRFLPQWEARVGLQWVGPIYSNDANTLKRPDFTVVNLGLDYAVSDKSDISLRVFNAFDEKYATGGGTTEWQLAPPRTGELSYRVKF